MEIKKHFKMYKAGKRWIIASIATCSFFTINKVSVAHADTINQNHSNSEIVKQSQSNLHKNKIALS